jgi:hypothetical protein
VDQPAGHPAVYDTLVALHVVVAVAGFGAVAISGAYGALARRAPHGEETRRYFSGRGRAEYLIVAVPFLGAAAMGFRPGGSEFGDLWSILGWVIWVAASGLLLGVVRPAEAAIRAQGEDSAPAGRRLMWAGAACDVLFVAALLLMVTQPA